MLVTIGTYRFKKTFACLCSRIGSIEHTLRVYFYMPLNSFVEKKLSFCLESPCRADEEAFVSDRDDTSSTGHDWERVCRNCDFNPKGTKNTKDVSRMRSIFLQLKQTPLAKD